MVQLNIWHNISQKQIFQLTDSSFISATERTFAERFHWNKPTTVGEILFENVIFGNHGTDIF